MAESVLVAGVKFSLEKLVSFTADQIGMFSEFKEDLESLGKTVKMVSAVVDHAEVKHPAVNEWLKSLEALACRAENVLDEVNYEILRRKLEDRRLVSCFFFLSHNKIAFQLRIARKLKKINHNFELINKNATALGLQYQLLPAGFGNSTAIAPLSSAITSRETVSIVGKKVMGRENDEKVLVHKLLSKSDELLTSIPIIGMGGLGKTTLAQSIYNNKQVLDHFGKRIWISVPQGIAPMSIFRLIRESFPRDPDESFNRDNIPLDVVVQKIKEKLQDKRYLLVLDDVWSGHSESSWGGFLEYLLGISTTAGNCIVITTREVPVGLIFSPRREDHIFLEKLSDEDCLEIVKEKAVIHEESIQYFEAMRRNIGKVCQGVPLVARVIGGLLMTKPANDWDSILQEGISNMVEKENDDIKQILQLSYNHLHSPSLKKCFTYCSLFGKNSAIDKKQLILLWMAQGFIQPKPGHDDMKIGSEFINSLIGSSLLEEVIDYKVEYNWVRMHDLVHDLAQSISNPVKDLKDLKEQDRHIVIHLSEKGTEALPKMKMLRTLFVASGTLNSMLLTSFKYLHVLKLSYLENDELPSSIRNLIHLRYLGVWNFSLKTFPKSASELYNLQTLTIERCGFLKALPEGITKLINLRHLHCDSYLNLPPKIGCLTNLQTVTGRFKISEYNQFKEFGFLKNFMGGLSIQNLEYVSNKEEAPQEGLNRKPITDLSYGWHWERFREDVNYEAVLEGLEPHPNVQNLRIYNFMGTQFPSWFMNMFVCFDQNPISSHKLDKLVSLKISSCRRCKQLPSLGHLPSLKYLDIVGLDSISCIEPSFYGTFTHRVPAMKIFPALIHFDLGNMSNLTEWMGYQTTEDSTTEAVEIFPNLEKLTICDCEKLRHAPIHYFQRLKHLSITRTKMMEEDQNCHRFPNSERVPNCIFTSLQSLEIVDCPYVSELPEYIWEFQSLRNLEIRYCSNLKSLAVPMDFHGKSQQPLNSLQKLIVVGCDGLNSFPHELINSCASLSELAIGGFCDSVEIDWSALSSSISKLKLDIWPNWVSLPYQLQHLTGLKELQLIQLENIENLPDWFANLVSLEFLFLVDLEKLCQLPSMAAMRSLKHLSALYILNCPLLEERCTPRSSPDSEWTKISHISRLYTDFKLIDSNADEEGRMSRSCRLRMRCF